MATPQGSEVDELDYWMRFADELYDRACRKKIKEKGYIAAAAKLDAIPGAGEYYRHLCSVAPQLLRLDKLASAPSGSKSSSPCHRETAAPAETSRELAESHQRAWLSLYGEELVIVLSLSF